jgi:alginate export protein
LNVKILSGVRRVEVFGPFFGVLLATGAVSATAEDAGPPAATDGIVEYYYKKTTENKPHPSRSGIGEHGKESPLELWSADNGSAIRLTFNAQAIYAAQDNSWFGKSEENLGKESNSWWETGIKPGVMGNFITSRGDEFYGKLNFVATSTTDIDAAGSNVPYGDTNDVWAERAYVGWRSGTLWDGLGKDFLDVSVGRRQYVAGNGFLFYSESSNGGKRGGYWLGMRQAADLAGIAKIKYEDLTVDLFYLKADDQDSSEDPNNNTEAGGITLDYKLGDFGGIGGGYYGVSAEDKPRDGMDIFDLRFSLTPFKGFDSDSVLAPLTFDGEYVYQDNGDVLEASGWYLSGQYQWDKVAWSPSLTYRYAAFEGGEDADGKSKNYDPLFYGFYDWGYWYQGEVLGEYVLSNSNLNTSMVKASVDPTKDIHVNLFYYHNELDDAGSFGVASDDFADEWNITVDWTATDYLMFSLVGAWVDPGDGAKEYTGGNDDWYYTMIYASFTFK